MGQIDTPVMIPDTVFVVKSCTILDLAVLGASLALFENNCPIDNGIDLDSGEATANQVNFQFRNKMNLISDQLRSV